MTYENHALTEWLTTINRVGASMNLSIERWNYTATVLVDWHDVPIGGEGGSGAYERTSFTYRGDGNLNKRTDPSGLETFYFFNQWGQPISVQTRAPGDASSSKIAGYEYDVLGLVVEETGPAYTNTLDSPVRSLVLKTETTYSFRLLIF